MLNLSSRWVRSAFIPIAVCVLAAAVVPIAASSPAQAQDVYWVSEDDGYRYLYNDNPELGDSDTSNSFRWNTPPGSVSNQGYGSNGFKYAYARARPGNADTYAQWRMGSLEGRFEVQVWIPGSYATAHVRYHIYQELPSGGGRTREAWLDQEAFTVSGWQSLGEYEFFGGDTVITVTDNATRDHYDQDGQDATRLAVDAIRMKEIRLGTTAPQPPPPPPPPPPPQSGSVTISLGEHIVGCADRNVPCRAIDVRIAGFDPDRSYNVRCLWARPGSRDFTVAREIQSFFAWNSARTEGRSTNSCWLNVVSGSQVYVTVDGVVSNTISFTGTPESRSDSTAPGMPTISAVHPGECRLTVSWLPPASDGGSPVTGYTISLVRASEIVRSEAVNAGDTAYAFTGLESGVQYTIWLTAENVHGSSRTAVGGGTPTGSCRSADTGPPDLGLPPTLDEDPPLTQRGDPRVEISYGDYHSDPQYCTYSQLPCRWVTVFLQNFRAGGHSLRCIWWHSETNTARVPIETQIILTADVEGGAFAAIQEKCSFNVRPGRQIYVTVDGVRSNTLIFPGEGEPPPSSTSSAPDLGEDSDTTTDDEDGGLQGGRPPGKPRDLSYDLQRRKTIVTWRPPADDSASTITDYTVTYSRGSLPGSPSFSKSYTVDADTLIHERANDTGNVTYRVTVVANNVSGSSPELVDYFITIGRYAHEPVVRIPDIEDSEKDEVPEVQDRYSADWNRNGYGGGTGGECGWDWLGGLNCAEKDGFWHTQIESVDSFAPTYVYWDDFGRRPLRGKYSVEFFVPRDGAKAADGSSKKFDASATARYTIKERRSPSDRWRTVGYFIVDQGEFKGKHDTRDLAWDLENCRDGGDNDFETWGYDERLLELRANCGEWELGGEVRIELQGKDGALAADSIRLVQRDLLSFDKTVAIGRCRTYVIDVLKKRGWISFGVDLAVAIAGSITGNVATGLVMPAVTNALISSGLVLRVAGSTVVAGKFVSWLDALNQLLKINQGIDDIYTAVRLVEKLSAAIRLQISEQLSPEDRKAFDLYYAECDWRDGVDGGRAMVEFGIKESLVQSFLRSGYLDYLDPDSVS